MEDLLDVEGLQPGTAVRLPIGEWVIVEPYANDETTNAKIVAFVLSRLTMMESLAMHLDDEIMAKFCKKTRDEIREMSSRKVTAD